jgi:hypothetical protein
MSAIAETEPGGEMVCILDFEARPRDINDQPIAGKRRAFTTGEHVRYIRHFFVAKPEDNPIGYMAIFRSMDAKDDNLYGARHDYFVSLDCWENLKEHFARNLIVTERDVEKKAPRKTYVLTEVKSKPVRARGGEAKG